MRGLLVDFGGVLTSNVFASFAAFCREAGLDPDHVKQLFRSDAEARDLLERLETGTLPEPDFEQAFGEAARPPPDGLIDRLFGGIHPDRRWSTRSPRARAGHRHRPAVELLGHGDDYEALGDIFDARVISAEEGMRKPDPRIYPLAAERMGLPPDGDRLRRRPRLQPQAGPALGMTTVLHTDAAATIAQLDRSCSG